MHPVICGECCAALAPDPRVPALEQENARLREQLATLFYLHSANSTASPLPPRCSDYTPPPPSR